MKKASRKPRKSNHVTRPSGLTQSKDGKYIYAKCVVSGNPTFFKPDYFAKVLARFGGDENRMAKEYVCKLVKDMRKRGFNDEQIKAMAAKGELKKPAKVEKVEKVKKPRKTRLKGVSETVVAKTDGDKVIATETRVVYPWTDNPGYFKSTPQKLDWAEASRDTCHSPGRYLDYQCEGCPFYDKCAYVGKIAPEDRDGVRKTKHKPKVQRFVFVSAEQLAAEQAAKNES